MKHIKEVSDAREVVRRETKKLLDAGLRLPPDPEDMNEERAVAAQVAVNAFGRAMKTDAGDLLGDLLCDLIHLADRRPQADGWNFERALARARDHYCEGTASSWDEAAEKEWTDINARLGNRGHDEVVAASATTVSSSCQMCGAESGKPHQDAALVANGRKIQQLHEVQMNGGKKILCTLCRDGFAEVAAGTHKPLSSYALVRKANIGKVHVDCLPPAPTAAALAAIYVGDFVKIVRGGERFWCVVHKLKGASVVGEINNDLVRTPEHGLKNGDILEFPLSDVIQIEKAAIRQQAVN